MKNEAAPNGIMAEASPDVIHLQTRLATRVQLRRIQAPQSPEQDEQMKEILQELKSAAAADNHQVMVPTHFFLKGGEIVGYASCAAMPIMNFWADSTKLHAADSLKMIEQGEAVCSHQGLRTMIVPCADNSPFLAQMERLGYTKLGATVLFVKQL